MIEVEKSSSSVEIPDRGAVTPQHRPSPQKKKRNLPGMPDPDAEVVALSPRTLLATNRFVCEICNKGFQRDQNLQLHRRGHNLPWKLKQRSGAGGDDPPRKRVYVCPEVSCVHHNPVRALGDLTGIKKHFCRKHGEKKWKCERCSKKYAVMSDWKAHSKTCGTREYRCDCGTLFSRRDSFITHRAFCDALAEESAKAKLTLADAKVETAPISPPLTTSTTVVTPGPSAQSSDMAENVIRISLPTPATGIAPTSTTSSIIGKSFPSVSVSVSVSPSTYSPRVCKSSPPTMPPPSLSLTPSSIYVPHNGPSSFQQYFPPQNPAMSATALLQKAAQMGATTSNPSFLRGLGLQLSSFPSTPKQWCAKPDTSSGLGLGPPSDAVIGSPLFNNKPTLDFLGLGPPFLSSYGGGYDVGATSSSFARGEGGSAEDMPGLD